jgi:DNA primase
LGAQGCLSQGMPGIFDYAEIRRVQQANDIVDVVGEHVSLKKKGREMIGLCPFHTDHRPSMYVNPSKQIFKCFACGAGGDVLRFVQMREGLTFPQAVERLAERGGIQLQRTAQARPQSHNTPDVDPNLLARANAWAAEFFRRCLEDPKWGKVARDYVAERKLSAESVKKWRIGAAPAAADMLAKAAAAKGIPPALLQQAGLLASPSQDRFVNRLMFTITDVTGRVIGFGGRTLDGTGAKYVNSPTTPLFDKSSTLYGLEQARHEIVATGTAVIVEGYTDVIMPHQFGCTNVVAALGTSFTAGHGRILRRYAERVVLLFDSDTAGRSAANRALEVCLSQRLDIKLAFVPEGKDPCEFLLVAGKEAFQNVIKQGTDVLQFKWDGLQEAFAGEESLTGRKAVLEEFLQAIATGLVSNNLPVLEIGLIVNKVAKIIGLTPRELNADLSKRMERLSRTKEAEPGSAVQNKPIDWGTGLYATAQREILEVLFNQPELIGDYQPKVGPQLFDVPILRQAAALLWDAYRSEGEVSVDSLLARTESMQLVDCIVELQRAGEAKGNSHIRLIGALEVLARRTQSPQILSADRTDSSPETAGSTAPNGRRSNPHSLGLS